MSLRLHNGLWVLVCDGGKALLLQNAGDAVYPKLETRAVFEHDTPPTRELGTDRPPRVYSGAHGRPSAIEEKTDLHIHAEEQFLAHVIEQVAGHDIKDLVVVAPARALGVLRKDLPEKLRETVRAEFDKDYVRMPIYEIEQHLAQLLSSA